jgi:hypothetical protein
MCVGPGRPLTAIANAFARAAGISLASSMRTDHFVTPEKAL